MRIVVRKGDQVVTIRELTEEVVYLGRSKKNEIVLADSSVSRRHAKLFKIGEHFYVEDLKSVNGTRYDGEKVRRAEIEVGKQIGIGDFQVSLEIPGSLNFENTVFDRDMETTFAEAATDLKPEADEHTMPPHTPAPPQDDDFMDAIAVRPKQKDGFHLKVLENFLSPEPKPAELLPMEKKARLVRLDGPEGGTSVELSKPEIKLGSSPSADIQVTEGTVSKKHAVIETTKGTHILHNQDELSGTFVDGVPIKDRELENHDIVQIGSARFEYVEGNSRSRAEKGPILERTPAARSTTDWGEKLAPLVAVLSDLRVLVGVGALIGVVVFYFWFAPQPQKKSGPTPEQIAKNKQDENTRVVRFHIDRARSLMGEGKYDEAESRLTVVLDKLSPELPEAQSLLTEVRRAREQQEKSETTEQYVMAPEPEKKPAKSTSKKKSKLTERTRELRRQYRDGVKKFEAGDLYGARSVLEKVAAAKDSEYRASAKKLLDEIQTQTTADAAKTAEQETKAKKAYMEGITFLEVVEDRTAALERFQEVLKLSPDPKSRYHIKAQEKIKQIESALRP
jgi:pSer/pThr/pTyr-binding forkhead associated (FHA) protein